MNYVQQDLGVTDHPLIAYNGALVLNNGTTCFSTTISPLILDNIWAMARHYDIALGLYQNDEWCVERTSERVNKEISHTKTQPILENTAVTLHRWKREEKAAHKIMLMGVKRTVDAMEVQLRQHFQKDIHIYRSNHSLIELAPLDSSKEHGLSLILDEHENLDQVMAFGDNYNDLEMLKRCGLGIAVANGREAVRNAADRMTKANTEDGVACFLEEYFGI